MSPWEQRKSSIADLASLGPIQVDWETCTQTCVIWRMAGTARTSLSLVEYILAMGLAARGVKPVFVLCDGAIPEGCVFSDPLTRATCSGRDYIPMSEFCNDCFGFERTLIDSLGLPFEIMKKPIRDAPFRIDAAADLNELKSKEPDIYQAAFSSFIRWLKGDVREPEDSKEFEIFSHFVVAARHMKDFAGEIVEEYKPNFSIVSHPFYVDWGLWVEESLRSGGRVITWMHDTFEPSNFQFRSILKNDRPHTHFPLKRDLIKNLPALMKPEPIGIIRERMQSRSGLPEKPEWSKREKTGTWAIFAHLLWDAHIGTSDSLFPSASEWLVETVKLANQNQSVKWMLKAHPAEYRNSSIGIRDVLSLHGVELGDHIEFVGSESEVDPYAMMMGCDGVVTINGTIGLEAASYGRQVVLGGDAPYAGFDVAVEPRDLQEYQRIILSVDQIPSLSRAQVHLAQALAFQIFVNQSIAIPGISKKSEGPDEYKALFVPGIDTNLDQFFSSLIQGTQISNLPTFCS